MAGTARSMSQNNGVWPLGPRFWTKTGQHLNPQNNYMYKVQVHLGPQNSSVGTGGRSVMLCGWKVNANQLPCTSCLKKRPTFGLP